MKKANFKVLALCALFGAYTLHTACTKNDDNGNTDTPDTEIPKIEIVGKWKHYKTTFNGVVTFHVSQCLDSHGPDYVEFRADNTYYEHIYSKDADGSCVFNGVENGSWEISGDKLNMVDGGDDTFVYHIIVLNDTHLIIFGEGEDGGSQFETIDEFRRW